MVAQWLIKYHAGIVSVAHFGFLNMGRKWAKKGLPLCILYNLAHLDNSVRGSQTFLHLISSVSELVENPPDFVNRLDMHPNFQDF